MKSYIKSLLVMVVFGISTQAHSATCKDVPQKDEMHSQTVCLYPNMSIERAYEHALKSNEPDGKQLRKALPKKHLEEKSTLAYVAYEPISPSKYQINLLYDGGETIWTMVKKSGNVKIIFDYYPD